MKLRLGRVLILAGTTSRSAVDLPNKKMTILSPSAGSLTGRVALAGSLEWVDQ
jgi:polyribonucleotide 5'-hydroxyl-kinase